MTPAILEQTGHTTQSLLQMLYGDIDGYGLAAAGRDRMGTYHEDFTYGDITPECAQQMLSAVGAKPGEVFYDLGAGTGKGVLFAALLFDFSKCVGIELLHELHGGSTRALQRYIEQLIPVLPASKREQQVWMLQGDMREHDWSDADIVYTHCTCFSPELMDAVTRGCEKLKPGARVITVSKGLSETPHLVMTGSESCQMAWGGASLYYYTRL